MFLLPLTDIAMTNEPNIFTTCHHALFTKVTSGMSDAEAGFARRLNVAKSQGKSVEEVEEAQHRKMVKEVNKRIQVRSISMSDKGVAHPCCY